MMTFMSVIAVVLIVIVIPILLVNLIVKAIMKKPLEKVLKALKVCGLSFVILLILSILVNPATWCDHDMQPVGNIFKCTKCDHEETEVEEKPMVENKENNVSEVKIPDNDWKTTFSEKGFTSEEISSYEEIFNNVGITDFHDVKLIENGRMHIVLGEIYDDEKLQLNVTLEERKIIVVTLTGIPDYDYKPYITIFGNLKFRKVNTTKEVDLYYDVDGGYVAKLDWENKKIIPYNE